MLDFKMKYSLILEGINGYIIGNSEHMKNTLIAFFAFLLIVQSSAHAQYSKLIDAKISFEFPSKNVKGSIEGFESNSVIDLKNIENSSLEGSVDAKTLDTNNFLRNLSLRSGRYFDVKTHPRIYFESSQTTKLSDGFKVTGDLTLKGTKKSIEIKFRKEGNRILGSTSIYASDFGIKIKKEREDNLVKVNFTFGLQ